MNRKSPKVSAVWYAVGAFLVTPLTALFCVLMGLMLVLAWPLIPFLCYLQRREEIQQSGHENSKQEAAG